MNFDPNEEQTLFKAAVERFLEGRDVPARISARRLPGGFDRARWIDLAGMGLIALALPEAAGGLAGSPVDCAIVAEAMGRGMAIEPWLECGYWPARLLAGQATKLVPGFAAGETIVGVAFAESALRFALDPRATLAQDGKLTGEKHFVLGGAAADRFIVTAREGADGALFLVDAAAPGVSMRPYAVVDGGLAAVLTLRDAPGVALPGGMEALRQAAAETALIAAAEMVGLAGRLFDDTLEFAKTREQFGQPIGRFQAVQHRLVDSFVALEQARSTLWRAALGSVADPAAYRREIAGAKAFIAERALHIGHEAVQLHGGMGMTDDLAIGHALKRVLLLSRLFGDPATALADYARAA